MSSFQESAPQDNATSSRASQQSGASNTGPSTSSSGNCKTQGGFSISPGEARIAPGGRVTFTASAPTGCTVPSLSWTIDKDQLATISPSNTSSTNTPSADLTLKGKKGDIDNAINADRSLAYIRVTATASGSGNASSATAVAVVTTQAGGNIVIPVIGFEQAGASSAQSSQKFFFNLFVSRPLPFGNTKVVDDGVNLGTPFRWFGNVRIATYPQQITSGVAEFATGFAEQVAKLKVNQLAQSGEFNLGLDLRLKGGPWGLYGIGDTNVKEYSWLSLVAGFGAISPLNPTESLQIFVTPPIGSPQRAAFLNEFPSSANSTYTGFVTPDRGRFYWEYGAGLRLTTLYFDHSNVEGAVSPAMLTYSLGQNQIISGGVSSGVVQRVEGFMPLPLGERFAKNVTTLYLFGRVDMRLAAPRQTTPFILQPAPTTVNGYDSDVNIVTVRSNRDLYTIGVGVDAVSLIKAITLQNKSKASSGAPSNSTPTSH